MSALSSSTFKTANNLEFEDAQYEDGQNGDPDAEKDWQAVDLKSKEKQLQ